MKLHAPATRRNREPIADVLRRVLKPDMLVVEVASGTGQHAAYFAKQLGVDWQPSDREPEALASIDAYGAEAERVRPAILLDATQDPWPVRRADAVVCINMIHISPIESAEGLFRGASQLLASGTPLVTYGPYRVDGKHTAPSNESFDASLRRRNPRWGIRDVGELETLAAEHEIALEERVPMPANNFVLVWRRH